MYRQVQLSGCSGLLIGGILIVLVLSLVVTFGAIIGVVALVGALVYPIVLWYIRTKTTVAFDDRGFTVKHTSRRYGTHQTDYPWHAVGATGYMETTSARGGRTRTTGHFVVETDRGPAFHLTDQDSAFHDIIEAFNRYCTHLPYEWQRELELTMEGSQATVERTTYRQSYRPGPGPYLE